MTINTVLTNLRMGALVGEALPNVPQGFSALQLDYGPSVMFAIVDFP